MVLQDATFLFMPSVRVRQDVYDALVVRADREFRSASALASLLLAGALAGRDETDGRRNPGPRSLATDSRPASVSGAEPVAAGSGSAGEELSSAPESAPVKSRAGKCLMATPRGVKCKFCGEVHR